MRVIIIFGVLYLVGTAVEAQLSIRQGDTIQCAIDYGTSHLTDSFQKGGSVYHSNTRITLGESIFDVKYTGFTAESKIVFDKAIEIWDRYLNSDVKIRVLAQWAVNDNPNNLGFVIPSEVKDFSGAPVPNVWYPLSLAEKLSRSDLNGTGEIDIIASFNSGRSDWYFGIDGNCPGNEFDLLTVILHEIGHGLGISGTFFKNGAIGTFGIGGLPKIYDLYVINGSGQSLIDQTLFPNGSTALGDQLTSNSIEFKSQIAANFNSPSGVPRLYAPNPYNPGSSISHLDQSYNFTNNGLMTPFATPGKVRHEAGPLIKGILYEMGWLHTYMNHEAIKDQEVLPGTSIQLNIESDTGIQISSVKLIYTDDNFNTSQEVTMAQTNPTLFDASMNPSIENTVKYYFSVKDILGRDYRLPLGTSDFSFYYGMDTQQPAISHTPITPILEFNSEYPISAIVTDNIGIQRVFVEYQLNNGSLVEMDLINQSNDIYTGSIDLVTLGIQQGDEIKYKIIAIDASSNSNLKLFPASGQAIVKVKEFPSVDRFISNLDVDNLDFLGDFVITKPTGFLNGAIHSSHPYVDAPGSELQSLKHLLLHPIIVKEDNGIIEFDEVVLIEPGIGSDYTDYVIVEASKDNGVNWLPLLDGYDSRYNTDWLDYYNSNILNGNSKAIGTLNYFRKRRIEMIPTFSPNDIIQIRFSLVSNSDKNGWGWAIDNLKIQDDVVGIDEGVNESHDFVLFPNPALNSIKILTKHAIKSIAIENSIGSRVGFSFEGELDISSLPSGMYFVKIETNFGCFVKRMIKM